jgi:hypothetical protein
MSNDKALYKDLRSLGVRKGRARKVSSALASRDGSERPASAKKAVDDLKTAAGRIQERMALDEDRRAAAQKAARTRKKRAGTRSKGARQMASGRRA